jgi:sugar lactone lactonase YvrE
MSCFHFAVKSTTAALLNLPAVLALSAALFFTGCGGGGNSGSSTSTLVSPTLAFASIPAQTYGNAPFTVSATSASSGEVTYTVTSGPATISSSTVTMTGAGTVILSASQAASGNYAAATVSTSFTVSPETPTLTFQAISGQTYGNAPFTVIATSASSGAVTYSVTSGPATISGITVTLTGVGTVNLAANQAANGNYTVATTYISFTVAPGVPTLSFQPISETYGNPPFTVSATSASSGAVTYTVTSGPATISGSTVTLTGVGTVVLGASQSASGNYTAASTSTSFTVAPEVPSLIFAPIPVQTYGNAPFTVSATSASSGEVTYTVTSGPATISSSTITMTGAGTVVLSASQAANGNYAATTATTTFTVAQPGVEIMTAQSGSYPINGGHVYLYAAATSGYGTAATSLLNSNVLTNNPSNSGEDSNGNYYVTTGSSGNFSITNDYTCTSGSVVYLYLVGGSYGGAANSAIGLLALLGTCPAAGNFVTTTPYVYINEVSTIAAAYAMAGFATDATHVSSSGTALAKTGIQNAFATAANLDSISLGLAPTTTPSGNGTVPQTEINTLANILAACINSAGPSSIDCSTLFSNAKSAGSTGTTPTDTATAAIYMAHNPGANVAALYGIIPGTPPFAPYLNAQPNSFTIAINFTGGGLNAPDGVAIDASGNIWVANYGGNSVTKLTSTGAAATGSPFTGTGLSGPQGIAIDGSDYVWVTNDYNDQGNSVSKLSSAGVIVSGSPFSTGGSDDVPIAIDASGNAWVGNEASSSVAKLDSAGSAVSGSPFTGGGVSWPEAIAFDASGNIWAADYANNGGSITKLTSSGAAVSGSPFTGGNLYGAIGMAIDGSGNAWVANLQGNYVTKFNNAGAVLSGSSGFSTGVGVTGSDAIAIDGAGTAWVANYGTSGTTVTELTSAGVLVTGSPFAVPGGGMSGVGGIVVDGSGNVWVTNPANSVTEFVGAAIPVVTPLVANLISPYSTPASRP